MGNLQGVAHTIRQAVYPTYRYTLYDFLCNSQEVAGR